MASTIGPARIALFALLDAAPGLATAQRTFGRPDAYEARKVVALGGVANPAEAPEQLGQRRSEETYVLKVGIKAHGPDDTDTAQAIDTAGFALADVVRGVVHDNLTLSGVVRTALVSATESDGVQPAVGGGFVIFLTVSIDVTARIT